MNHLKVLSRTVPTIPCPRLLLPFCCVAEASNYKQQKKLMLQLGCPAKTFHTATYTHAELLQLLTTYKPCCKKYELDGFLESHPVCTFCCVGYVFSTTATILHVSVWHSVECLCLPPYHSNYLATEIVGAEIQTFDEEINNTF